MRHPIRILALLAVAAASASASAALENPNQRGPNHSFYYDSLQGMPRSAATPSFGGTNPLAQNELRRPTMRLCPLTPVPPPPPSPLLPAPSLASRVIPHRHSRT